MYFPTDARQRRPRSHLARENAGHSIEIPTGVGFCMYNSRKSLDESAPSTEEAFGRGYGEEGDFCMRATRAGFTNLLCGDVFVFHEGEVSFGDSGAGLRTTAQALIDSRYPEFQDEPAQLPRSRTGAAASPARGPGARSWLVKAARAVRDPSLGRRPSSARARPRTASRERLRGPGAAPRGEIHRHAEVAARRRRVRGVVRCIHRLAALRGGDPVAGHLACALPSHSRPAARSAGAAESPRCAVRRHAA